MVEPKAWYRDYVKEIAVSGILTWRKLFEGYLRVKSGRNDGYYEHLNHAEAFIDKDHVYIYLKIAHGC